MINAGRFIGALAASVVLAWATTGSASRERSESVVVRRLNPEMMHRNPAFTQAITVDGPHRVVYIGGQNAVDASGNIVGKGDIAAQCEQVARNLETVLSAAGATIEDVVKWNIYVLHGQSAGPAFGVFQRRWGKLPPPTISVIYVPGLAHPDFLIEIDGIAVVAQDPVPRR